MFSFSLTTAVRMALKSTNHITIAPAEDGSLQGLTLSRADGTKLHVMHRKVAARFMECHAVLPEGVTGDAIAGHFGMEQAYDLTADFIAGMPMVYDDTHWADTLTPEQLEQKEK